MHPTISPQWKEGGKIRKVFLIFFFCQGKCVELKRRKWKGGEDLISKQVGIWIS